MTDDARNAILRWMSWMRSSTALVAVRPFGEPAKQPATPAPATGGYGDATNARDKT